MAAHLAQAIAQNRTERRNARAVIEQIGRQRGRKLEVDGYAVSLVGTDALSRLIERETPLVVARDDLLQLCPRKRDTVARYRLKQGIDSDPATRLQRQPDRLRLMAQMTG
ncbi:MAG TPA: hypothetical protein VFN11_22405 [Ktedonobacterales bacterium]|nr:hypothetical protein [Ktedonobacterales bacterium]